METLLLPNIPLLDPTTERQVDALPNSELHLHLEGTMAVDTFLRLARENNHPRFKDMPETEVMRMYQYKKGPEGFDEFLDLFGFCSEVIQKKEDIIYIVEQLGDYALSQNMRYAEVTYTPATIRHNPYGRHPDGGGLSYADQLEALAQGVQHVETSSGGHTKLRFILDHSRGYSEQDCLDTANMCLEGYRQGVVVAMGLGGGEVGHPVSEWAPTMQRQLQGEVPIVPHVAEVVGPNAIFDVRDNYAGHYPGAQAEIPRFGHGIQAAHNDEALQWIADQGILLEICPSSNLATGAVPSLAALQYLVRRLQQFHVPYTVNTDNPAMMPGFLDPQQGNSLNKEWKLMVRLGLESPSSLARMCLLGVQASLLPTAEKQTLMDSVSTELAAQGYDVPTLQAALPRTHPRRR